MRRTVIRNRVIEVKEEQLSCDLCDKDIATDEVALIIEPSIVRPGGGQFWMGGSAAHIDVCSVDCLQKNAHVVGLLLNSKLISALRTSFQEMEASRKDCARPGAVTSGAPVITSI